MGEHQYTLHTAFCDKTYKNDKIISACLRILSEYSVLFSLLQIFKIFFLFIDLTFDC